VQGGIDVGDVDAKAARLFVPIDGRPTAADVTAALLGAVPESRRGQLAAFVVALFKVRTMCGGWAQLTTYNYLPRVCVCVCVYSLFHEQAYMDLHFTYLEINPLVVTGDAHTAAAGGTASGTLMNLTLVERLW
jgi:ATP citrate (pro-S)-lyase